jgi:hypothetical protein
MVKQPQRVYSTPATNSVHHEWMSMVRDHNARILKNGESPQDYPTEPVAYETLNFGWILSRPDPSGHRHVLVQF